MFASPNKQALPAARWLIPALVVLTGFIIGYIHHRWFYPLGFHSDAAAMQVLAQAMVDEGSLLPLDFVYGNQLIMFRSSPFIALALACGAVGYDAYIIGSSLSIAVWMLVLYAMLAAYTSERLMAFVVAALFTLPMGMWDFDFVLGQQSHLSNAVFAACMTMAVLLYCTRAQRRWLALAAAIVFLMSAEAPIRALLVMVPLVAAVGLYFGTRHTRHVLGLLLVAFVLGTLVNKGLVLNRPLTQSPLSSLTLQSTATIVATLQSISMEMLGAISSANEYAQRVVKTHVLLAYLSCIGYLLATIGFVAWRAMALHSRLSRYDGTAPQRPDTGSASAAALPAYDFPAAVALLGLVVGALAVAVLRPDTARHILWTGAMFKLTALLALFYFVRTRARLRTRVLLTLAVSVALLLASYWTAILTNTHGKPAAAIEQRNQRPLYAQIRHFAAERHIAHIYGGGFWNMMTLNATIPGMGAGTLNLEGDVLVPEFWLARRSQFAVAREREVLYYLKDLPVDKWLEQKLSSTGGTRLYAANGDSLWVGKPLWRYPAQNYFWKGCQLPTQVGQPTAQCHMQHKAGSAAGFLTFGPYAELPAGKYRYAIDYASGVAGTVEAGDWDVLLHRPNTAVTVLQAGKLNGTQNQRWRVSGTFSIDGRGKDDRIELRTKANANSALRIEQITIDKAL